MSNEMNYWVNRKAIIVQGVTYYPMNLVDYSQCENIFDIIDNINPTEYAPYYKKFIIKTKDNKYFEVEQDDLNNIGQF